MSSFLEFRLFQRRSLKFENVSVNPRPGGHLVYLIGTKNLVDEVEILLPVKFPYIPFSAFRGEVEKVSANQMPQRPSFFQLARKPLVEDFVSSFLEFYSVVSEKSKISQPIRDLGGNLAFLIGSKNINCEDDVEILFPVKFR